MYNGTYSLTPKSKRLIWLASSTLALGAFFLGITVYQLLHRPTFDDASKATDSGIFTQISPLWGKNGERWNKDTLPDFSYAGYLDSITPLPNLPRATNVKDFGAKGDGKTDDTAAFKRAIAATYSGGIFIPKGKYVLSDRLMIQRSDVELVGESKDDTVLLFTKPLAEVMRHFSATNLPSNISPNLPIFPCYLDDGTGYKATTITNPLLKHLQSTLPKAQYDTYHAEICAMAEQATNGGGLLWFGFPHSFEVPPAERQKKVTDYFQPVDPNKIAKITQTAPRNSFSVTVDNPRSLGAGDYVVIETGGSQNIFEPIFREVYGYSATEPLRWRNWFGFGNYKEQYVGISEPLRKYNGIDMVMQIQSISGNTITFKQPLSFKVDKSWNPRVLKINPQQHNGVRNLTIQMPNGSASRHLEERGFNAIGFRTVTNSWVTNVKIVNADIGLNVAVFSADNTFSGITLTSTRNSITHNYLPRCESPNLPADARARCCSTKTLGLTANVSECKIPDTEGGLRDKPYAGHYGLSAGYGAARNLFTDISINTSFAHDISVSGMANRNVFANITGSQIVLDHHTQKPYENLFTNINAGKVTPATTKIHPGTVTLYSSSGSEDAGPKSGARETFWNIYDNQNKPAPAPSEYVQARPFTFGFPQQQADIWDSEAQKISYWVSNFPKANYAKLTNPQNLYAAQLTLRTGSSAIRDGGPQRSNSVQCDALSVFKSGQPTNFILSNTNVAYNTPITLQTLVSTKSGKQPKVSFCWSPLWNDATGTYANWADGATNFTCQPAQTVEKNGGKQFKASFTTTAQQLVTTLPSNVSATTANSAVKKLVVMIRMYDPENETISCSANPGINGGHGSEFINLSRLDKISYCATGGNGSPCNSVIGFTTTLETPQPPETKKCQLCGATCSWVTSNTTCRDDKPVAGTTCVVQNNNCVTVKPSTSQPSQPMVTPTPKPVVTPTPTPTPTAQPLTNACLNLSGTNLVNCLGAWVTQAVSNTKGTDQSGKVYTPAAARANPAFAFSKADFEPSDNVTNKFYSLGYGGEVIYKFSKPVLNVPGFDIVVFEATQGQRSEPIAEDTARIEVSQDGQTWKSLGTASSRSADGGEGYKKFDLASTGFSSISYVKVKDTSDRSKGKSWDDGFDIDAIGAVRQ